MRSKIPKDVIITDDPIRDDTKLDRDLCLKWYNEVVRANKLKKAKGEQWVKHLG